MKTRSRKGISLVMTLVMILTVFVVIHPTTATVGHHDAEMTVDKKVWNENAWADYREASIGDTVQFNISIKNTGNNDNMWLHHIVVNDTLPLGLSYVINSSVLIYPDGNSSSREPDIIGSNYLLWNFSSPCDLCIGNNSTAYILFNASVTDYGELNNSVLVNASWCGYKDVSGKAWAIVNVPQPPSPPLIFEKQVWNGTEWSDVLDGVHLGENVQFQLTITYVGVDDIIMKCATVEDYLPTCCLEYVNDSEEFIYPDETLFEDPEIIVSDGVITFDWPTDKLFNLYAGQTIIIRFSAEVVHYCYDRVDNRAVVHLWSCPDPDEDEGCHYLTAEDCASVNCTPPPTRFDKFVKDGDNWVEKINTSIGSTLRFRLELTYYGNDDLENIRFYDELPCILEYADNLASNVENITDYVEVSNNSKQIWWNLTCITTLHDGETIYIEFDANVIGTTGSCCDCEYVINYANVIAGCTPETEFFMEDEVKITSTANCPPTIPGIRGPTTGTTDEELTFYFVSTDPDGDQVYYMVKWGDGTNSGWLGPFDSGDEQSITHVYTSPGTYKITAIAKDTKGATSGWTPSGYEHVVTITPGEEPVINLSIDISRLSFGEIKGTIENTGDIDVSDVDWVINVTGGILNKINLTANGTIDELNQGDSSPFTTGKRTLKHGFGRVTVVVTAVVDGQEFTETFHGFVLGRIFINTYIP